MAKNLKNKTANIFRNQLVDIKTDWELIQERENVIFINDIEQYNSLLKKTSKSLGDEEILHYIISDDYSTSSSKGNKYFYPNTALFEIKNLIKHVEGKYKIVYPEASFIKDGVLRDKYTLFLLDKKQTSSNDVLLSATLEFEDKLRKIADLPSSCFSLDLANKSLNPKDGKLEFDDKTKDLEGFYNIVKGFFGFIRGKPHHTKTSLGRSDLYKELIIIDKLLNELNNLKLKQ